MVLAMFGGMAIASSSSTTESTKIEVTDKKDADKDDSDGASDETEAKELKYEITDQDFQYYTNSIGTVEYYGYVEIENTGSAYIYMKDCVFDLEDNDGHLLQSDDFISSCPDVIAPGEKGYFYNGVGSATIDDGVSFDNGVKLVPNLKLEEAKNGSESVVDYEVTDTDLREGSLGEPKVTGRITNNTEVDDGYLYVNVVFYNSDGKVIAITGTSVTDLTAGSTVSFECSGMFMNETATMESIADYKVIARKMHMQF